MKPNQTTQLHPAKAPRLHLFLPLLLTAGLILQSQANDENSESDLAITIQFSQNTVSISGAIADPQTLTVLAGIIRNAQPGCQIQSEQLRINPTVSQLPPAADLEGILMELALSTRGGTIQVSRGTVSIWGLTDSLVAHSALQFRLENLAGDSAFQIQNGIEVISTEALSERTLPLSAPARGLSLPQLAIRD